MARIVRFGEFASGIGGEFERDAMRELRHRLSEETILVSNLSVPRGDGSFYEIDVIVMGPTFCDILELKCLRAEATVFEDRIVGAAGFSLDRVFSTLDNKAKVLSNRLKRQPFAYTKQECNLPWINNIVVVPNNVRIAFKYEPYKRKKNVKSLEDVARYYKGFGSRLPIEEQRKQADLLYASMMAYRDEWTASGNRTKRSLGRFKIRKDVSRREGLREYLCSDEPPCKVDVRLKEYPYDPLLNSGELAKFIADVSREMQALRTVRHQYIACVTGHFQTGASLVEISDWFDGRSLEESWDVLRECSLLEKVGMMIMIAQGLGFCHEKGVFHRNVCAENVLVNDDLDDVKIMGFEYAKSPSIRTLSPGELEKRDNRVVPPEELLELGSINYRLYDIFQAGVLFFRILENGRWPYESSLEFYTSGGRISGWRTQDDDLRIDQIRDVIYEMMKIDVTQRIELMERVESSLRK